MLREIDSLESKINLNPRNKIKLNKKLTEDKIKLDIIERKITKNLKQVKGDNKMVEEKVKSKSSIKQIVAENKDKMAVKEIAEKFNLKPATVSWYIWKAKNA